jgi:regulator of replication initiation timing
MDQLQPITQIETRSDYSSHKLRQHIKKMEPYLPGREILSHMTDKKKRISDIVNQIESLTLEANILTRELKKLRKQDKGPTRAHGSKESDKDKPRHRQQEKNRPRANPTHTHDLQEGDRVVITNGYLSSRGTNRTVFHQEGPSHFEERVRKDAHEEIYEREQR